MRFDINSLNVSRPCPVPWDSMHGDDRVRKCDSCELNIFNVEAMTREEVTSLIGTHEGRLCIRLLRRSDGTVATNDCPVGLRAFRKKAARHSAAVLSAVLGLFSISFGQKNEAVVVQRATIKNIAMRHRNWSDSGSIKGAIFDVNGAVIPDARVELFEDKAKNPRGKTTTDKNGSYSFPDLVPGKFRIEVTKEHFKRHIVTSVVVEENRETEVNVNLEVAGSSVITVGIFAEAPMIDMSVAGPTPKTITREDLDRIPGGRPF